jgi:hypothetical protein
MAEAAQQTIVDVIESSFDAELGPDLISQIDSLPHASLFRFHEAYDDFATRVGTRIGPDNTGLRPYIPAARLHARLRRGILDGTGTSFDDLGVVDASMEALHRLLLYCHSIALLNPLVYITDLIRLGSSKDYVRNRLANYLSWINYARPLIDSGTLLLLENREASIGWYGELSNSWELANRYFAEADFSDTIELPQAEAQRLLREEAESATGALEHAIDNVAHEWAVAADSGFAIDHFLPTKLYLTALQAFISDSHMYPVEDAAVRNPSVIHKLDAMRLMALLQLDLPDFEFSARDLVQVREGEQFVQWRADLGSALDHVILLADHDLLGHGEGLRILQEELISKRRDLEKSTGRSKYLSEARAGNTTLITGALTAVALSSWLNPAIGVASLAISTALQRAWAFRRSKVKNADVALLNHYVLFTKTH